MEAIKVDGEIRVCGTPAEWMACIVTARELPDVEPEDLLESLCQNLCRIEFDAKQN